MSLRTRSARQLLQPTVQALRSHLSPGPIPSSAAPRLTPLHLPRSLIAHWPALLQWRLDDGLAALRRGIGEDTLVEVELGKRGRGYLDEAVQRLEMPFGTFLDAFILRLIPSSSESASLPTAYLAQSLLPPVLEPDVPPIPHFEAGPKSTVYRRTLWIGPGGSFTPFHRDPYHGLYTQIVGQKTFYVLAPSASSLLLPSSNPLQKQTSTIPLPISRLFPPSTSTSTSPPPQSQDEEDVAPQDAERYRRNLQAGFDSDGACSVVLQEGESVLVPEGWWHSAEGGEGAGVGVGAWFR